MAEAKDEFRAWAYTNVTKGVDKSLEFVTRTTPSWVSHPPKNKHAVEVLCMSLNPVDYKLPESPIESRVARISKPATPGLDFCGRPVAHPDRLVFGRLDWPAQHGTLGRYVLVNDDDFAEVPQGVSAEQAAAIPIAALTAYQSIVPFAKEGGRVAILGGSGGVGTFSIQIAKLLGCYVVATCSSRNELLCKDLGAGEVVDYTKVDVAEALARLPPFDLIVDNVGNDASMHRSSRHFLKPSGRFVLVSAMLGSLQGIISMAESLIRPSWLGGPPNAYTLILCQSNKKQLQEIAQWVVSRQVKVIIDEVFDYADAPKALTRLRSGRARGKIVVKVAQ